MKNSNFYRDRGCTQRSSFWSNFDPVYRLKMVEIKHGQLAIQISLNQSPISFQLSIKTIITFCSSWAFFGYNCAMDPGQRSRVKRLQLRLAPLFQKPLIILSDHFFDFWLWTQLDFQMQNFMLNLLKKNSLKNILVACQDVTGFDWLKRKDFEPIEKKFLYR